MDDKPFDLILKDIKEDIPVYLLDLLPRKWEKIGDVVIIKIPKELQYYYSLIGRIYSNILNCRTILNDIGGIQGEYRKPKVELIYGDKNSITVHKENGVFFKIDPARIMFSSGNMSERKRMANISNENETVVDMFAGIGYFSVPMAVYSHSKKIISCEINPVSYSYLVENVKLNHVADIIEPVLGNNLMKLQNNIADRVIMGYIGDTSRYIEKALNVLKDKTGLIHFHDKYPDGKIPDVVIGEFKKFEIDFDILHIEKVKSYAPGVSHYVFDIRVG